MSHPNADTSAKIFLAIWRSRSWTDALTLLASDDLEFSEVLNEATVEKLTASASVGVRELPSQLEEISREIGPEWVGALGHVNLVAQGDARSFEEYSVLERAVSGHLSASSCFWISLKLIQAEALRNSGHLGEAEFFLREAEQRIDHVEHELLRSLWGCFAQKNRGLLSRAQGDFASAYTAFERSESIMRRYQLISLPMIREDFATLHWASGQYERALELHRENIRNSDEHNHLGPAWLLRSHLSAAKCAIDAYETDIAGQELRAAEQLLRESSESSLPRMLEGYYRMYSGEWKVLTGQRDDGLLLLDAACEHFESMDPPFHSGLLDAKISIAQHAISRRDYRKLLTVIHKLLDESAEKGCIEARARLLVLESALFVSDNPPLGEAFQDLVTRLHLINNPALLMQALGNLFAYSLRYLDQPDQAFLMARLRNLQKVLDASCYQDLYEKYIEEQYGWAIENRLGDFLEEAPNPEDLEEA